MSRYVEFYPNEQVALNELSVFMYCGTNNIPSRCFCGCICTKDFSDHKQAKVFETKGKYRFFKNKDHIKRYRSFNNI